MTSNLTLIGILKNPVLSEKDQNALVLKIIIKVTTLPKNFKLYKRIIL